MNQPILRKHLTTPSNEEIVSAFSDIPLRLQKILKHLEVGDNEKACEVLLDQLDMMVKVPVVHLEDNNVHLIELLCNTIKMMFLMDSFVIPDKLCFWFISHNTLIANLFSITSLKNTDKIVNELLDKERNFVKILTLYSHRNTIEIDIEELFKVEPIYVSWWYGNNVRLPGITNEISHRNIKKLIYFDKLHEYFTLRSEYTEIDSLYSGHADYYIYFSTCYIAPERESYVKNVINQYLRKHSAIIPKVSSEYNKKKIAVISAMLIKNHAIYKCIGRYFYSLKDHYHLTLFYFGPDNERVDYELFDEVHPVMGDGINFDSSDLVNKLYEGGFYTIIFPEIGMIQPIIVLSNLRFSPLQISMYGHPVSTWGGEIDYFIGGAKTEIPENPESNYSERLVLMPDMGMFSSRPNYELKNVKKGTDALVINFNWGANKFNFGFLEIIKRILFKTSRKIVLDFITLTQDNFHYIPIKQDLNNLFKSQHLTVQLYPDIKYDLYMERLELCDISIDAYPWGGYNRVIDLLHCKKPIAVMEGTKAYNRLASTVLRQIGLEELIAHDEESLTKIVLNLIEDDDYRESLKEKISNINYESVLFDEKKGSNFKKAIDYLIETHEKLKQENSRKPIYIDS